MKFQKQIICEKKRKKKKVTLFHVSFSSSFFCNDTEAPMSPSSVSLIPELLRSVNLLASLFHLRLVSSLFIFLFQQHQNKERRRENRIMEVETEEPINLMDPEGGGGMW